ncbi:hypothetical protein D3C72_358060 [compost metagenome]
MSVEQLSSLNLHDMNVHAENFFRDFLNLALGYDLKNINIIEKNARAIDLGDADARIAIQVTSTSDLVKIKHTHKGFVAGKLDEKYDRLVVLIIGERKAYREQALGDEGAFSMSLSDDVWGISDLLTKISDLPLEKLDLCCDFLRRELRIPEPRRSNEVNTLVRLIEVLSASDEGLSAGEHREDPDPTGKIRDRFAEHAKFLEQQYVDLHELYGRAYEEVSKHSDLGHVRVRKLQIHLMHWSDRILSECGGDPKAALQALTERVVDMMGASDGGFDEGAIRYFLVAQLIACNVFPNKQPLNA